MGRARLLILALLFAILAPAFATEDDKGLIASLISRALSSHTTQVSVGAVDGAFSSDATVRDIVLSDADGPWLKIDKARLVWTRLALLQRRLQVDQLDIGTIQFLRRPLKGPPNPDAEKAPILPDLPLKVIIKQFTLHQLALGEPVFGTAAQIAISGHATLGPPSEGLDLDLEGHRLDAKGDVVARLNFVPQTTALSVGLTVDEPAGGLLGRIANLPGLPPVKFAFQGAGPLDAFHASLDFTAGPEIGANGAVDLARQGGGRALALDMKSRLSGMFPAIVARVFAGETDLQGNVFFPDDGGVEMRALHLVSQAARLDVEGSVKADGAADLKLHAGAIPGAPDIGKLDLNARLSGALAKPDVSANFTLEDLRSAVGTVGAADATFSARANGPLSDPQARIALALDADVTKLVLNDPAINDMIGGGGKLTLRGAATPDAAINIDSFQLLGPSATVAYTGEIDAKRLHGRASVDAPDLSRFARAASIALKGAAHVEADLDGAPADNVYAAQLSGKFTQFATGVKPLDGLTGGTLELSGGVRAAGDGGYAFDRLKLTGAHGRADIDGAASSQLAKIHAEVDVPDAKALDARVVGALGVVADLTGSLTRLDGVVDATLRDGRLLDRPTPRLELTLDGHDLTGKPDADAKLEGEIDRKTVEATAHIARGDGDGWRLDPIALALGSVKLQGALAVASNGLADGRVDVNAGELDDLSPLVLTRLRGSLNARVILSSQADKQGASLTAKSASLSIGATSIANLAVDLRASDVFGALMLDGGASASRVVESGETISEISLTAKAADGGSDLDAKATARGFALAARGRLAWLKRTFRLAALTARGRGADVALDEPATFAWERSAVSVDKLSLGVEGGRLVVAGSAGDRMALKVSATALPLALADLASPGLGLTGRLSGDANIRGALASPEGDWRVKIDDLSAPALRSAALAALSVAGSGRLAGGRSSVDATIAGPSAGSIKLAGSVPLTASGALDLRAAGKLDIAAANRLLGASGQRASGEVVVNATLQGDLAHPRVGGAATISHGAFSDEARGFKIEAVEAEIAARGDEVQISRFHASTPNGGTLGLEGRVKLDPAAGFPGSLKLTGANAQLISNEIVSARANLSIELSGALARAPRVSGRIDVETIDINIPSNFSAGPHPLIGPTRHIDPGPTARARLAIAARAAAGVKGAALFVAQLDLVVSAPSRVFLRGRGVNAEFGGEIRIAGATNAPRVNGGFDLRAGTLVLLGGQLDFTRGRVAFHGDASPELDMTAQTTASDITAYISVTGPAAKPAFTFTSSPSLPEDEILSRILYQKASGSLTAFQALQLANAIAQLSGRGDAFDSVRKALGVDSLDVGADSTGGAQVGARKTINDRLSLGVTSGAKQEDNGVAVYLNVTKHLRLQGGVDAKGGSTAGAGAQWEY